MFDSIVESIAVHADRHPDKLCLADTEKDFSYSQVWQRTYGLSKKLSRLGVKKGDCVLLCCTQNAEYMICCFALQLLHAIYVPLEAEASSGRIDEISRDTDPVLMIVPSEKSAASQNTTSPIFSMEDISSFEGNINISDIDFPHRDETSELLFSTGTTGKSKGIELTHGNDIALAENVISGVEMKPDNIELIPMPLSHSHGLRRTYANMVNGSSAVFLNNVILVKVFFQLLDRYKVTSMDLAPSIITILFKLSKDKLGEYKDQLDYIQLGSAPLPEETKAHLSQLLPHTRLYNFYGTTESGCSCIMDFNKHTSKVNCIGAPAKNANFIFVDENRNEINSSKDNMGFMATSGAMNMKGYWRSRDLTLQTMENGYIYTHDMGYKGEDGLIYFVGRQDDVINCGGIKIAPEEIESVILKEPSVEDCACIPISDPVQGQAPKLFLVMKKNCDYDAKAFNMFLHNNLDKNKLPKKIELLSEIPRTYNGKIKRKQLLENERKNNISK